VSSQTNPLQDNIPSVTPQGSNRRWPTFAQWIQLPRLLSQKERVALVILVCVFFGSSFSLARGWYLEHTVVVPARGGSIVEGLIGSPRFLNPVYADANDVDRDLLQLLFSGLYAYNSQGELVADLAQGNPEITEGGKVVTVSLKEDVKWHDGEEFSADDVLFTIQTLKDPAYKSPVRANWIGVDVEKVGDYKVRFHLLDPYVPFVERLTLKILPQHIWSQVSPEAFPLSPFNLGPVGTGPYKFDRIEQERSSGIVHEIHLESYEDYHLREPLIASIVFRFFESDDDLLRAANQGSVHGFSLGSAEKAAQMTNPAFGAYSFSLPRYFALFFNLAASGGQREIENDHIRKALQLITDKEAIMQNVLQGQGNVVHSPFLPSLFGIAAVTKEPLSQEAALALLSEQGYVKENGVIGKPVLGTEALQRDLNRGDSGEEVERLQQCLAQDPDVYPDGTVNGVFGPATLQAVIRFQEKYAAETLTPIGLTKGTGKAGALTREKLNALCFAAEGQQNALTLTIATVDQPPLRQVAQELERQWELFGIQTEIQLSPAASLERDVIKPRAYQTLLFGEVLGKIPDPFPFWHSSQVTDPGLNLSSYQNQELDKLLEAARREPEEEKRKAMFEQAQSILLADVPALFLYDLPYTYFVSKKIQGVQPSVIANPSWRFAGVGEWYIETRRAGK